MIAIILGSFIVHPIKEGIETGHWKMTEIIVIFMIFLIFIGLSLLLTNKFIIVEFKEGKINIHQGKYSKEVSWDQVYSLQLLSLTNPPIYILKLKDIKGFILFVAPFTLFGHFFDNSDLGEFIEKMRLMYDF